MWSFIHIEDAADGDRGGDRARRAAASTTSSTTSRRRWREWLPVRRERVGAKPPRHVPRWLGRLLAGEAATVMMTEVRGASNAKAKRELGWQPRYPSWRAGLRRGARRERRRTSDCSRSCGRRRSRSPTGCSAASSEAEDVVQEALLRAAPGARGGASGSSRRGRTCRRWSPGWRSTSCARRGRGARRTSASGCRSRSSTDADATTRRGAAEMADSLSLAFLVLLESLSPEQRAAFLLHDVFDYRYDEIAEIVGKSEDNARQLAARARRHVEERRPRFETSREQRDELAGRFFAAVAARATWARSRRCSPRTSCCTATAAARCRRWPASLHGRSRVARTLRAWMRAGGAVRRRRRSGRSR